MIRVFSSIAIVLFISTAIKGAEPAASAQTGGTSPQDVFEIFRKAVLADDWATALAQFDEPSRQFLIAGYAAPSLMGILGDKGKEIARSHLTDEKKFEERMAEIRKLPQKDQNDAARSLAVYVKDAPALFQKITAIFRVKKMENWMLNLGQTTLVVEKEDSEMAVGKMHYKMEKGNGSEGMNFRKINGRWYLSYQG